MSITRVASDSQETQAFLCRHNVGRRQRQASVVELAPGGELMGVAWSCLTFASSMRMESCDNWCICRCATVVSFTQLVCNEENYSAECMISKFQVSTF